MRRNHVSCGALVVALLASACGPSALDLACPGQVRPALTSCSGGRLFVECGGESSPRFACSEANGECLWFTGACVAAGFHPSECDADDRCCFANEAGTWAFESGWAPAGGIAAARTLEDVGALGGSPITRASPASIVVTIDPSLGPPATGGVSCDGSVVYAICSNGIAGLRASRDVLVANFLSDSPGGIGLVLEVVPQADGSVVARAVPQVSPDHPSSGPATCEQALAPGAAGAVTGSLVLSGFDTVAPELLHGRADLTVGASGRITFGF
jgi:hypothetical protein